MKNEVSKRKNIIVDLILLASINLLLISINLIIAFISGKGIKLDIKVRLEHLNNSTYMDFLLIFSILALIIFLSAIFRLKVSGKLSKFFSSNIQEKRKFFFHTLKELGFKKGIILKRWPFYLAGALLLVEGAEIFAKLGVNLMHNPRLYSFLLKSTINNLAIFLGASIIFSITFDYFLDMSKSLKLSYIYLAIFLMAIYFLTALFMGDLGVMIVPILDISLIFAPLIAALYYWSDNSIYYPWILMSLIGILADVATAINLNIFKM